MDYTDQTEYDPTQILFTHTWFDRIWLEAEYFKFFWLGRNNIHNLCLCPCPFESHPMFEIFIVFEFGLAMASQVIFDKSSQAKLLFVRVTPKGSLNFNKILAILGTFILGSHFRKSHSNHARYYREHLINLIVS